MSHLAKLKAENAQLRQQLAVVIGKNVELIGSISQLNERIVEQNVSFAELNERVAELLSNAERKHRKPVPPKQPEPPPVVEGEAKDNFDSRPKPPELPAKVKPEKGRQRPTGRNGISAHLPAEEHTLKPEQCVHCGSIVIEAADEMVEEKLHVVKEQQRRRVVRRTTCRCRTCGSGTTPRSLPALYERSKVTCEWLA